MAALKCPWCGRITNDDDFTHGEWLDPLEMALKCCVVSWLCRMCGTMIQSVATVSDCEDDPLLRKIRLKEAHAEVLGYLERGELPPYAKMDFGGDEDPS